MMETLLNQLNCSGVEICMDGGIMDNAENVNSTGIDLNLTIGVTSVPDIPPVLPSRLHDWQVYVYCGLVGFGLLSNALNMVVIGRLKSSVMYIYLKWIAFFEFCFSAFLCPGIVALRIAYTTHYVFLWINIYIFQTVWYLAASASMLLTVIIGYDRIYHIKCPLNARANVTKKRARIMVGLATVVCFALRLPFLLHIGINSFTNADNETFYFSELVHGSAPSFIVTVVLMAMVFDYFCPISLAVCSIAIIYYTHKIKLQRRALMADGHLYPPMGNNSENSPKGGSTHKTTPAPRSAPIVSIQEERLMVVLVTMSLMSILCNVPVTVLRLIWPPTSDQFLLKNLTNFLFITAHSVNVFVYTATDRAYWKQLVKILSYCKKKGELTTHSTFTTDTIAQEHTLTTSTTTSTTGSTLNKRDDSPQLIVSHVNINPTFVM